MTSAILVGATDGIGLALARELLRGGGRVGLLGRSAERVARAAESLGVDAADRLASGVLDVRDRANVTPALDALADSLGGVDVLVYCAGVIDTDDAGELFAVNVVGAIDALEWGAERMAANGAGRLAAIGSIAGDRGRARHPVYGASKAALHQYLEGLRARVHGAGVGVTTIKPGWVRTKMLGEVPRFPPSVSAENAASAIVHGLRRGRDVLYVPRWWELVSWVVRAVPRPIFKRLSGP